jgi:hypothetical protein
MIPQNCSYLKSKCDPGVRDRGVMFRSTEVMSRGLRLLLERNQPWVLHFTQELQVQGAVALEVSKENVIPGLDVEWKGMVECRRHVQIPVLCPLATALAEWGNPSRSPTFPEPQCPHL